MLKEKDMKIIKVPGGRAPQWDPSYVGNIVTDGLGIFFWDSTQSMWNVPTELLSEITKLIPDEAVLESTKEITVTDLLALKTTFHTDDIIKLRESDLI